MPLSFFIICNIFCIYIYICICIFASPTCSICSFVKDVRFRCNFRFNLSLKFIRILKRHKTNKRTFFEEKSWRENDVGDTSTDYPHPPRNYVPSFRRWERRSLTRCRTRWTTPRPRNLKLQISISITKSSKGSEISFYEFHCD